MSVFGEGSSSRAQLGAALRSLRQGAGLTQPQLAERLQVSQSTVSRVESGQQIPAPDLLERWAEATGGGGEELATLAERAETEAVRFRRAQRGLAGLQRDTGDMEASAGLLLAWHATLVPGLLQTAAYARAVYAAAWPDRDPGELEEAVAARLARQQLLHTPGRRFGFLVAEAALRWRFFPPGVMAEQLARLAAAGSLPGVELGVVPLGLEAPVWHSHQFTLYDQRAGGAEAMVHVELLTTAVNLRQPADVDRYRDAFARLREVAVAGEELRRLLASIGP